MRMIKLAAVVLPGTYLSSLAALTDSFWLTRHRRDRLIGPEVASEPGLKLSLLSIGGKNIRIEPGFVVSIDDAIHSVDSFDMVWLPAFRAGGTEPMRTRLDASGELLTWLRSIVSRGGVIAASGAAVALPVAAGLIGQRSIPVATALLPVFRSLFPRLRYAVDEPFVDDGQVLLSGGLAEDMRVVRLALGRTVSPETERYLAAVGGLDPHRTPQMTQDPLVDEVLRQIEQRFTEAISIADLARGLGVTHAVLVRRFRRTLDVTPSKYLKRLQLAAAQRLLARSDRSIDSIALAVGFSDARVFRLAFRRATGCSATAWRKKRREII